MHNNRKSRFFHMTRATRTSLREALRTPGFGILDTLHGYIYGRWPYFYIGIVTGKHRLVRLIRPLINLFFNALNGFPSDNLQIRTSGPLPGKVQSRAFFRKETFADTYHGKVLRTDAAKTIVSLNRNIRLTDLETIIPYKLARDIVLKHPERMMVMQCPCRMLQDDPCRPLDVCLIIGEPFVSVAADHHADKCRWVSADEAIAILKAEARRGHVHHAFFKEAALGRFFAICNCCSCCCGAMQAHQNGIPMLASSGYVSVADEQRCVGCGTCAEHCPFGAIHMADSKARVDARACMGCGVCEGVCPQAALTLKRDYARSDPLEIDRLLN
jgi:ferredoxin